MASTKRGKRKSPFQDVVFEVSDDDMSPEHQDIDEDEPGAKVLKLLNSETVSDKFDIYNLKCNNKTSEERIATDDSFENNKTLYICSDEEDVKELTCEYKQVTQNSQKDDKSYKVVQLPPRIKSICKTTEDLEEGELQDSLVVDALSKSTTDSLSKNTIDNLSKNTDNSLSISITFNNKSTADLYKLRFIKFLESLTELEVISEDDLTLKIQRDPLLNPCDWLVIDEVQLTQSQDMEEKLASPLPPTPQEKPKKKKKKKAKVNKDLFIVDTNPADDGDALEMKYSSKFQINEHNDEDQKSTGARNFISGVMCFNCNGKHSLKDCPLPRDYGKINVARTKMQQQKQTQRYHLEPDQKYGHLRPGKFSSQLRDALDLKKHQLPPFIYQMRMLGYPPGWLEEAKCVHSNLDMFDTEGRAVRQANRKIEGLDPEKIVDYPGFNVPMAKHFVDEYKKYRLPPYSDKYNKQNMLEFFDKEYAKMQDNLETCDMDLDTTNEDTKPSPNPNPDEKKKIVNPRVEELKKINVGLSSPTLKELEKQKENLLAALEDGISSNVASEDTGEEQDNSEKSNISKKSEVTTPLKIEISSEENLSDSEKSPVVDETKAIKNSSFGTHILKSSSPYSRLPNPDNFMKDVSPVINFENLPDSTGKYEQMTEVLQKVRNTMKGLQNCKS